MKTLLFTLCILFPFLGNCDGKIVYLVAMPRSSSTAFMRMMQNRGDFEIMHEPSNYVFGMTHNPELVTGWFTEHALKTDEEVKEAILEKSQKGNLFVKEIGFFVHNFLLNDTDFIKKPNIHFVFLIRNPHNSVISLYKKHQRVLHNLNYLVGCRPCYEIFEAVKKSAYNPPIILFSEDLYSKPKESVEALCHQLDIPFKEEFLHWETLPPDFNGYTEWNEIKKPEQLYYWHNDVIQSTGFHHPTTNGVDTSGNPTFEEIENPDDRQRVIEAYQENLPYYLKFLILSQIHS